jgi:hypothetical protein
VESFDSVASPPTITDRIRALTVERMHLASAAPWWSRKLAEFGSHHLNAPTEQGDLSRWLAASIDYLKQELGRCVIRR